jgi:hypothetical protein
MKGRRRVLTIAVGFVSALMLQATPAVAERISDLLEVQSPHCPNGICTIPILETPNDLDPVVAVFTDVIPDPGNVVLPPPRQAFLIEPGNDKISDVTTFRVVSAIDPNRNPVLVLTVRLVSEDLDGPAPAGAVLEKAEGNDITDLLLRTQDFPNGFPAGFPTKIIAFSCTSDDSPGGCDETSCTICNIHTPEPVSFSLVATGLLGAAVIRRRRGKRRDADAQS